MTKTITILTASTLALITNAASAFDFYGGFTNQETVPNIQSQGHATSSHTWTSLDALQAGNPDSSVRITSDYIQVMDATAPRVSSLDALTAGSPDSSIQAAS